MSDRNLQPHEIYGKNETPITHRAFELILMISKERYGHHSHTIDMLTYAVASMLGSNPETLRLNLVLHWVKNAYLYYSRKEDHLFIYKDLFHRISAGRSVFDDEEMTTVLIKYIVGKLATMRVFDTRGERTGAFEIRGINEPDPAIKAFFEAQGYDEA